MKRKSFSPSHDTVVDSQIKPELKKRKPNEQDENCNDIAPQYTKESASKPQNGTNPAIESSVDRFLNSLIKNDRSIYTNNSKAKTTNEDNSPICKNLNATYGDISELSEKREPFQELTQLKLARKLAKLNKLDESTAGPDLDFNEKISKKLELMVIGPDSVKKLTGSKKSESLKKALQSVKSSKTLEGLYEVVEDEPQPTAFSLGDSNIEMTPKTAAPGCISPDFFRVLTAQDILLQDIEEDRDVLEKQEPVNSSFTVESPNKKSKSSAEKTVNNPDNTNNNPNNNNININNQLRVEEEEQQQASSRNSSAQCSSKLLNKRRQSFSVREINSKSKAFQAFSGTIKTNPNPIIQITPSSRRTSTAKPANSATDRRKSVHVPNVTDSGNKSKPSRKSCAPEHLGNHQETLDENNKLKKDLKRKNKEIENLKREKQALIRKLKAVNPELVGEDKEDQPLPERVSRVYCRVKPLVQDQGIESVVNYPEIDGMKSPSRGIVQEVSVLKCIELNNGHARKSDFYFDRVFSQKSTQNEVFEELLPVVQNAIKANNSVCIVSLGSEDSGKEYIIQGNSTAGMNNDSGVLPRMAEELLSKFEVGRTESNYLKLEFGCVKVTGERVVDILCHAERKQEVNDSERDTAMLPEESYTLPGLSGALKNMMWKQVGDMKDLFKCIEMVGKVSGGAVGSNEGEVNFLMFVFKVIHGDGQHNFIQFVEVDISSAQDMLPNQSPMKIKHKALPDFFANLQKVTPETKEMLLFYNINPSEENYMQSKVLLESSLRFTNPVKPLSSYL